MRNKNLYFFLIFVIGFSLSSVNANAGSFGFQGDPIFYEKQGQYHNVTLENGITWLFAEEQMGYSQVYVNGSILVYNLQWALEYQQAQNWKPMGVPLNVTVERIQDYHLIVTRNYTDYIGNDWFITWDFYSSHNPKITVKGIVDQNDYRLAWYASGINTTDINQDHSKNRITLDEYSFNFTDVYQSLGNITTSEIRKDFGNHELDLFFDLGNISNFELDPTFGKTAIGGSTTTFSFDNVGTCKFTLTENARVTSIWFRVQIGGLNNNTCVLYDHDAVNDRPGNVIATTNEVYNIGAVSWVRFLFPSRVDLSNGTYHLGWNTESSNLDYWYDAGSANQMSAKVSAYPNFPDPFGAPLWQVARDVSIFAVYDFEDDFELGNLSRWDSNTTSAQGVIAVNETASIYDTYGLYTRSDSGGDNAYAEYNWGVLFEDVNVRFYFRYQDISTPAPNYIWLACLNRAWGVTYFGIYHNATGRYPYVFYYHDGANRYDVLNYTLSNNTIYCVEIERRWNDRLTVYFDGSVIYNNTGLIQPSTSTIDRLILGHFSNNFGDIITHFDEVIISEHYIGPLAPYYLSLSDLDWSTEIENTVSTFSIDLSTNSTPAYYWLEHNASGAMVNETAQAWNANGTWTQDILLPEGVGLVVGFRFHANTTDISGSTAINSFITISELQDMFGQTVWVLIFVWITLISLGIVTEEKMFTLGGAFIGFILMLEVIEDSFWLGIALLVINGYLIYKELIEET